MRALAGLVAAAMFAATPALLSPAAFRDRLAAAMAAVVKHRATAIDDRSFTIVGIDGQEATISIDNAYALYLADPADLDALIARYARLLVRTGGDSAEPIEQLVVIVRPSGYVSGVMRPGASTEALIPARPLAGDLSYFLAVDSPDTIRTTARADLRRWRISEAAAWRRAVANVKNRIGALRMGRLNGGAGASVITADSGLAPSMLADPLVCGPASPTGVDGQVVLVHSRDSFIFALPSDRAQTRAFWGAARRASPALTLSSTPLTCRGGKWVVAAAP